MSQSVNIESINKIDAVSYYYENILSLEDLYLFRAVFNFHINNFKEAISDFE